MYPGEYTLIGNELSFFTRKLRLNCVFSKFPGTTSSKPKHGEEALMRRPAPTSFPCYRRPTDGYCKTPFQLGLFERALQRVARLPNTPLQRALCFILEDAFNHWLGRVCVHSRWCYPKMWHGWDLVLARTSCLTVPLTCPSRMRSWITQSPGTHYESGFRPKRVCRQWRRC